MEMVRNTSRGTGFRMLALKGERVVTSDLIRAEIRSAAWRYVRADMMDEDEAMGIIDDALDLVDEFIPLEENAAEAFAEAVRQNRSVYDMFYHARPSLRGDAVLDRQEARRAMREDGAQRRARGSLLSCVTHPALCARCRVMRRLARVCFAVECFT